jgi:hypothetical protein
LILSVVALQASDTSSCTYQIQLLRKMLDKLWDDVVAGPRPETGLDKLRRAAATQPLAINTGTAYIR